MPGTLSPIRIGYCLSLTGPVAGNTRSARLAQDIWREDVNRRGGLLGRPVELICYDDHGDASLVPGIYKRLMDGDKVDLVIGGYGTNSLLPAMPLIMARQRFFIGLMGLGVNNALAYPNYFAMIPTGPDPNAALTEGFFALAAEQRPRPATVALLSADAEFSRNPILGARANTEKYGLKIVHEATYPLVTTNFEPLIDAVAVSGCDLLFLCSYLADSIGLVRAIRRHAFHPKMVGGAMIGPQNTEVKTMLGPLLNGFVNYEYWVPAPKLMSAGVQALLTAYQARAPKAQVDLLGHYMAPLAYAQMQVVSQAVEATGGFDDMALAAYARTATFHTVVGDITFGTNGEWSTPRVLQVQFRGIVDHEVAQFRGGSRQIIVSPPAPPRASFSFPIRARYEALSLLGVKAPRSRSPRDIPAQLKEHARSYPKLPADAEESFPAPCGELTFLGPACICECFRITATHVELRCTAGAASAALAAKLTIQTRPQPPALPAWPQTG